MELRYTSMRVYRTIHESVSYKRRRDLETDALEGLVVQVSFPHAKHLLVTTLYRPPNATVAWYNDFDVFMDQLTAQECELVLMGDIDIYIIQGLHTAPPAWQDIINNHQMSQIVQVPLG